MAWNGVAGSVRRVKSCLGEFRQGTAGEVRLVEVRCGMTRYGRHGTAGRGSVWYGKAWQARLGSARQGSARQGMAGLKERRNQHGVPMENPNRAGIGADGR